MTLKATIALIQQKCNGWLKSNSGTDQRYIKSNFKMLP